MARDHRNEHLEKLFGTVDVPFTEVEVKLPDTVPEAFQMVLNYIYTDRIDCKYWPWWLWKALSDLHFISSVNDQRNDKIVLLMMDIYQLAVQYLIPRLEHVSILYLECKISKSNVLDALFYADKMKWVFRMIVISLVWINHIAVSDWHRSRTTVSHSSSKRRTSTISSCQTRFVRWKSRWWWR